MQTLSLNSIKYYRLIESILNSKISLMLIYVGLSSILLLYQYNQINLTLGSIYLKHTIYAASVASVSLLLSLGAQGVSLGYTEKMFNHGKKVATFYLILILTISFISAFLGFYLTLSYLNFQNISINPIYLYAPILYGINITLGNMLDGLGKSKSKFLVNTRSSLISVILVFLLQIGSIGYVLYILINFIMLLINIVQEVNLLESETQELNLDLKQLTKSALFSFIGMIPPLFFDFLIKNAFLGLKDASKIVSFDILNRIYQQINMMYNSYIQSEFKNLFFYIEKNHKLYLNILSIIFILISAIINIYVILFMHVNEEYSYFIFVSSFLCVSWYGNASSAVAYFKNIKSLKYYKNSLALITALFLLILGLTFVKNTEYSITSIWCIALLIASLFTSISQDILQIYQNYKSVILISILFILKYFLTSLLQETSTLIKIFTEFIFAVSYIYLYRNNIKQILVMFKFNLFPNKELNV